MVKGELNNYMIRVKKNPHFVESLSKEELFDFMTFLDEEYFNTSDVLIRMWSINEHMQDTPLNDFLERQSSIKHIKGIYTQVETQYNILVNPQENEELPDLNFEEEQQKIIYLDKIGVLDFLRKEHSMSSSSELAKVLNPATGIKAGTIRKTIDRIIKKEIKESTEIPVLNIINKLKLNISKEKK